MEKSKTLKYSALFLIALGLITFFAGFAMAGFDFKKLTREKIDKKSYTTDADIDIINIESNISDVIIKKSTDGSCRIDYSESKNIKIDISVSDGVLKIKEKDKRKWYDYISNINFYCADRKITVYLPEDVYESVTVSSDTGDLGIYSIPVNGKIKFTSDTGDTTIYNLSCDDVVIDTDTGDVDMDTVRCNNIKVRVDTGDIVFTDVIAAGELNADTDTGDVEFKDCDAETIVVRTDTGDIEGTLLSEKIIIAKTDTGDVKVPESLTGGACKLTTDTGDIIIKYTLK